jgi:hypothetical protein
VPPENLFMDPLAGPAPLGSPASPDSAAPAAVFAAPPAPETFDDEPWTEPEIPYRPTPSAEQPSSRDRAGQRTHRPGRNGGRGTGRDRRAN